MTTPTIIPNPGLHLSSYTVYDRPGSSRAVYLCDDCADQRRVNGTMGSKWSGECINGYCDDCHAGPSVSHFRLVDPDPAPLTTISIPCPAGCSRTVAARGKEIHYCVVKEFGETHREYVATYDGEIITRAGNNSDAECVLDDYVLGLCEDGLIDQPLAALAEQASIPDNTDPDDFSDVPAGPDEPTYHAPGHCRNCGGAHHIQKCGEIATALAVGWTDGTNPDSDKGCSLMLGASAAVAALVVMALLRS